MTTHSVEVWQRHFAKMAKGKTRPDKDGHYFIGSVQTGGNTPSEPSIKFVTPTAHAVELARSELKHEEDVADISKRIYKKRVYKNRKTAPENGVKKRRYKKISTKDAFVKNGFYN